MSDFERRIKQLEASMEEINDRVAYTKKELKEATVFTAKFLGECQKAGIKKVGISRIPKCKEFGDFPFSADGSVFAIGNSKDDGRPAIWGVVEKIGLNLSCGNGNQCQVDTFKLVDGIYALKQGKWRRTN